MLVLGRNKTAQWPCCRVEVRALVGMQGPFQTWVVRGVELQQGQEGRSLTQGSLQKGRAFEQEFLRGWTPRQRGAHPACKA